MQPRHIDVADPSEEGHALAAALRERGFRVRCADPASLAPDGHTALVVLAGDHERALSLLDGLRGDPRTTLLPVIFTGVPASGPDDPETLRRLGADAVYPRPLPIERIVRRAQTFVTPAEQLRGGLTPALPEGAPLRTPPPPPPPSAPAAASTLAISADADSWHVNEPLEPPRAEAGPRNAMPSARVMALLREADQRLFPDAPEVDLGFADPGAVLESELQEGLLAPEPLAEDESAGMGLTLGAPQEPPGTGAEEEATTATARGGRSEPAPAAVSSTPAASFSRSRVTSVARARALPLAEGVLAADWAALLVLGARQRLTADDVRSRLGADGTARLATDATEQLAQLGVEEHLAAWLARHDGDSVARLLAHAPPEVGAPGLVLALVALGALVVQQPDARAPSAAVGRASQRGQIAAAHARAMEGDYFAILGVPRDATPEEIAAAHESLRRAILAEALPSEELARERAVALRAVDEAGRILSVDRLRTAYRDALERSDTPG